MSVTFDKSRDLHLGSTAQGWGVGVMTAPSSGTRMCKWASTAVVVSLRNLVGIREVG